MEKINRVKFRFGLKQYLIIAIFFLLSSASTSNAALSLDQSTMTIPNLDFSKIFNGLSLPGGIDFTKNTKQINQDVSNLPLQKYKTDITQFVSGLGLNNLLRDTYSFFIGIIKFIGGIVIWILEFILVIIRRGLSFIS